ncbi:hypothetical protein M404DRAFT_504121 [Pisolithus tinctorius Marx 270]|uniref:Uncharacterized protein n=1 Tax=Pisolithus tinctorius Marx 270 TaxID=870435 RepID=A0A0C3NYA3_PISTI|nr:hypothetical protein M404DRAFT_504121 [Pisolithus tinctorius Marx 270]
MISVSERDRKTDSRSSGLPTSVVEKKVGTPALPLLFAVLLASDQRVAGNALLFTGSSTEGPLCSQPVLSLHPPCAVQDRNTLSPLTSPSCYCYILHATQPPLDKSLLRSTPRHARDLTLTSTVANHQIPFSPAIFSDH